jgi:hypothetical protein
MQPWPRRERAAWLAQIEDPPRLRDIAVIRLRARPASPAAPAREIAHLDARRARAGRWHRACTRRAHHTMPRRNVMLVRTQHLFMVLALVSASACAVETGSGPAPDAAPEPEPDAGPVPLTDTAYASQCGGYGGQGAGLAPAGEYCDAEVIRWSYDAGAGMLEFLHARYEANCCAERLVNAQLDGAQYQIIEREYGIYGDEPCGCTCVFDVALTVPVPDQPGIDLAVILDGKTAWDPGRETLWSGKLDLAAGAGEIVLSDEPSGWCDGALP